MEEVEGAGAEVAAGAKGEERTEVEAGGEGAEVEAVAEENGEGKEVEAVGEAGGEEDEEAVAEYKNAYIELNI